MATFVPPSEILHIVIDSLVEEAVALRRAGRLDESASRFDRALASNPQHAGALVSYAMLLLDIGDLQRAIEFARRAILVDPARMSAHHVLGEAMCRAGSISEGIAALARAVELRPDAFDARVHLGNALAQAGELAKAEEHLVRARELAPGVAAVAISLGNLYHRQGNAVAAVAAFRNAIELDPRMPQAHNNLGNVLLDGGDVDAAIVAFRQALELAPDRASTWSNLLLALNRSDRVTMADFVAQHRAFGRHFGERVAALPGVPVRPPDRRRLKIGYVSSDFASHAVALFIEPLLARHDRRQFEIYCFHNANDADEVTRRIEGRVEHFVPVVNVSDDDLAAHIRTEAIDVLVDLNGHTAGNRLLLFARKPAPIQVTWLGYLATTGLATMDYRFTDARADPQGLTEALHTETLWRLPETAWCYEPYAFAPDVGALPALRNGHMTFACLSAPGKISPAVVNLWARILATTPRSRLLLIASPLPQRVAEIDRLFSAQGVTHDRIEHLPRQSTADYLALYNRADIVLDSWPCAGGTTTCDALWMGAPVVTLAGERSFSRSGASLLSSVGLPDLVAGQPQDYIACAVALSQDVSRLAALRASLRDTVRASPLTDAERFARAVETAYIAMVEGRLDGDRKPPSFIER